MAAHTGREQGAFRRLVNLGLLIGGFGLGQGSIFIAQTWLVATGKKELLAQFGTHFSFAMLGIIAVESGSLTILSAQIARLSVNGGAPSSVWQSYWETTAFRLTMAGFLVVACLCASLFFPLDTFSTQFMWAIMPAFVIWAFNCAGFLDGLQKSGISGITGAIAYIAAASGLVVSIATGPDHAGLITAGAISIGYALTVALQFVAVHFSGFRLQWVRPSASGIRRAFVEEFSMLAGLLPGQLYFRAQLAISTLFLGTTATAMLVYAKQIIGAGSQISGFARRIEFPRMVHLVEAKPDVSTRRLVWVQKISFALTLVITLSIIAAGLVISGLFAGFTAQAWQFLTLFSVTILTEAIGQSLVQALFARHMIHAAAIARLSAVAVATLVCYLLVTTFEARVFVLADLVSHCIVILSCLYWLKRSVRT